MSKSGAIQTVILTTPSFWRYHKRALSNDNDHLILTKQGAVHE
ncbi:hypothetical protein ESA_02163 [Cronobacter sakazakii ATCC BAA-894]|uniref:Uncharacterized protein n=1 Tax=Cronobacter sakazakii (strain ATCC BAA-894) TaxID=290339 RepID=A7MNU9_CROS8|nr:hypothetical protein ESA_02163 [Cronobacter sakazakii ATCC BAA-894]